MPSSQPPSQRSESPPTTPTPQSQLWTWEYPEQTQPAQVAAPLNPSQLPVLYHQASQDTPHEEDEEIPEWAKTPSKSTIGVPLQAASMSSSTSQPHQGGCHKEEKVMNTSGATPSAPSFHLSSPPANLKHDVDEHNQSSLMLSLMKSIRVHVDPAVRTDIASLRLVVQCAMTVGGCIDRLVQILAVDRRRTSLCDPATKVALSIWKPVPDDVLVVDDWAVLESLYHMVNVYVNNTDYSFIVPAEKAWTHQHFKQYVGAIIGGLSVSMMITDMAGKPWIFPDSYAKHSNIRVYTGVLRG